MSGRVFRRGPPADGELGIHSGRSEKEFNDLDSPDNSITRTLGDASSMISKLQVNAANGLNIIDEVGSWNIASCLVVLNVFVWETYSMDYLSTAMSMGVGIMEMDVTLDDLRFIENTINIIFSVEYGVRFFASGFSKKWFFQPQSLVDLAAVTPGILQIFGVGGELLQGARILRILRLLRLVSGDTNNRFFLLRDAGEVTVKLYEILVEFFVIFFTTSAIIFNIEHAVNPEFGDLGDSLYWSFLTLTGNEQPFDVMTGNGRLAAVLSYTIAIAVVPGQLARLLATLGDQQMKEMEEMARGRESNGNNPKPLPMLNTKGTSRNMLARLLPMGAGFLRISNRTPPVKGASVAAPTVADSNRRDEPVPRRIARWGPEQVQEWLSGLGLARYNKAFGAAAVDGEMLLRFVDETALQEDFGVALRVHRQKILFEIDSLRA